MDRMKASNATFLDDNTGGKGKYFNARILQAGLVKYSFGVCLLEKDTIDKFVYNFVGCPVIIDHKDVTNENAKDERVGVISRVWFEQSDGWYWVEGIIFDEKAISLINDGYNVSCQYEISEYANNVGKKLHNGNPFDKVILNGKPEHLAIVKNPRYENAMIAVNALDATNEQEFRTADDGHVYPLKRASEYGECYGKKAVLVGELADIEKHYESLAQYSKDDNNAHSRANKFALDMLLGKAKGLIERLDAMNASDEKGRWITIKGTHIFIKEGQSIEDAITQKELGEYREAHSLAGKYSKEDADFDLEQLPKDIEKAKDLGFETVEDIAEFLGLDEDEVRETLAGQKEAGKFNDDAYQKFLDSELAGSVGKAIGHYKVTAEDVAKEIGRPIKKVQEQLDKMVKDGEVEFDAKTDTYKRLKKKEQEKQSNNKIKQYEDKIPKNYRRNEQTKALWLYKNSYITRKEWEDYRSKTAKNSIIQAINEIKETSMFSKLFKKKEKKMDKDELKSLFMECLSEMVAKNEADEKKEDEKLADDKMAENEDDMKEDKKDEEKADNKCKNEVVDKRDIIRQIMAIAGKHEDNEDVRTIAKLAEKLAYDKSEADRKADNKCKNEDEEKEDEKEKASNSLDEIIGKMSAGTFERKSESYMTQKKAVELGDKLF